jgi:hypothetical protein
MVAHKAQVGHYDATWNNLALGRTEDGWTYEINHKGETLMFEEFGDSIIDLVGRGAELTVEATLKEWKEEGLKAALWPWSDTFGQFECAGRFAVANNYAKALVLTASTCSQAGTEATESDGPKYITFHKTIFAPEMAARINLNNKPRVVPVRFNVFLTDVGTGTPDYEWFREDVVVP